ncbi:tRNA pseudouridine(38/39) synthase-like isoform X2 [Rhopilema esculentum]
MHYVKNLNQVLPQDIRALAWAPVSEDFDARFNCCTRTYKYFFPLSSLDIEAMQKASDKLLGEHDFRNFCKVDVGNNVNHFVRKIESINISACDENGARVTTDKEDQMFEITICGMAFLWHQVRCMVSVLFLIGLRLESSEVIDRLLDVEFCPKKPQYSMASEVPLVLYDCTFDKINWIFETDQLESTTRSFRNRWTDAAVRKSLIEKIFKDLQIHKEEEGHCFKEAILPLMTGHRTKNYRPLLTRPVCDGLERHLEKQAAKRKKLEERREETPKD